MSLEINQDLKFQGRMWRAELIARFALAGLLITATLGLFGGGGWLSRKSAVTAGRSVEIRYQAYGRRGAEALLQVRLGSGTGEFWIDSAYLEKSHLAEIQPQPEKIAMKDGRTHFRYPPGDGISTVRMEFRPRALGSVKGRVGSGGELVEIRQWILP